MEDILSYLQEGDVEKINKAVESDKLCTSIMYKEFLSIDEPKKLSNETLALYACGPMDTDILLGLNNK